MVRWIVLACLSLWVTVVLSEDPFMTVEGKFRIEEDRLVISNREKIKVSPDLVVSNDMGEPVKANRLNTAIKIRFQVVDGTIHQISIVNSND